MKKKVLICGITGFIGRNISEAFNNKSEFEVYGTYFNSKPSHFSNIKTIQADLTNKEDVDRVVQGMDIIIQVAAVTSGSKDVINKPYIHVTDNAVMNSLIFRAAYEHHVSHVIFPSCTVMYESSSIPIKEIDFNANAEIYPRYFGIGWTKVYVEKMCEFYAGLGRTKYTVLRQSNIYGPYDKFDLERSHVFGATMTKVLTTKGDKITVWGSGEEERDLLYISDLVAFVEKAIEVQKAPFELCNIGLGRTISVKNLVEKIISRSKRNLSIEFDLSQPTIKTKICLDINKAKEQFKWEPQTSLGEGIDKTIKWYKYNYK